MGAKKGGKEKTTRGQVGDGRAMNAGKRSANGESMTVKKKMAGLKVWQLVLLLVVVIGGTVLFVGAASGWFGGGKVVLDAEYYCGDDCDGEMTELDGARYEELVQNGGSFVVFVDQSGCTTADRLRGYVEDYAGDAEIRVYRMMFAEARETSLHDYVKYYPSVVIVSRGRAVGYLRADSDEDADYYNDYEAFRMWMGRYL
ncbi:hypothetical protein IJG22_01955 [Candidatus Saccharibacteria bacterium]|nr:hypothetical protein [Candidatus Saccharibacteria bacterium]